MESLVIPNIYGLVRSRDGGQPGILLQERWKPDSDPANSGRLELPGGKWRAFEPALDCLRREVEEETGLVIDADPAMASTHRLGDDTVDVLTPPLVVQMTSGPYPSVLVVIPCTASGTPASTGDGSRNAAWHEIDAVRDMLGTTSNRFTALTYAALQRAIETGLI